jgi:Leu/Phe-tRNA-protein transferase
MLEKINVLERKEYNLVDKKIILRRSVDIFHVNQDVENTSSIQSSLSNYLDSDIILISREDNPEKIMDTMIAENYPYEYCYAEDFDPLFLVKLIKAGFLVMSSHTYKKGKSSYLILAMHHLSRVILYFDHIHIKRNVKNLLEYYELKFDVDFELIFDKCVQVHGDDWLTKPLINAIKGIKKANNPITTFSSFGLYKDGILVAGDFGTVVGRVYSSYSGFYDEDNTGTIQMILTAKYLERNGYAFWDLGMPIKYKMLLGARTVCLPDFLQLWRKYAADKCNGYSGYIHYPIVKTDLAEEDLIKIFLNAYRYFYVDDLKDYLSDDFHYASQHVFEEIKSKEKYLNYLSGKFATIKKSMPPDNILNMKIVYDSYSGKPYLFMRQDRNEALFVAEVKDGKFKRIDLCIPGLYRFQNEKPGKLH